MAKNMAKTKRLPRQKRTRWASAVYKTVLRTMLLERESIAPIRLRQILKPYLRMLS